jgi:hypothetical protein
MLVVLADFAWWTLQGRLKRATMSKKAEYPSIPLRKKFFDVTFSKIQSNSQCRMDIKPKGPFKKWINDDSIEFFCLFDSGFLGSEAINWNLQNLKHDSILTKTGSKYEVGPIEQKPIQNNELKCPYTPEHALIKNHKQFKKSLKDNFQQQVHFQIESFRILPETFLEDLSVSSIYKKLGPKYIQQKDGSVLL